MKVPVAKIRESEPGDCHETREILQSRGNRGTFREIAKLERIDQVSWRLGTRISVALGDSFIVTFCQFRYFCWLVLSAEFTDCTL